MIKKDNRKSVESFTHLEPSQVSTEKNKARRFTRFQNISRKDAKINTKGAQITSRLCVALLCDFGEIKKLPKKEASTQLIYDFKRITFIPACRQAGLSYNLSSNL